VFWIFFFVDFFFHYGNMLKLKFFIISYSMIWMEAIQSHDKLMRHQKISFFFSLSGSRLAGCCFIIYFSPDNNADDLVRSRDGRRRGRGHVTWRLNSDWPYVVGLLYFQCEITSLEHSGRDFQTTAAGTIQHVCIRAVWIVQLLLGNWRACSRP